MTGRSSTDAFAAAVSAMVHDQYTGDILARLVSDCVEVVDAGAVAILVVDEHDRLTMLSSSSARATHLEMLQVQESRGPCIDVVRNGSMVTASGARELTGRWGRVGAAIIAAGFQAVDTYPLTWHGRVLGGFNVFRSHERRDRRSDDVVCQAFADIASVVLVQSAGVPDDEITARVHEAVMARSRIEQAKGVLSYLDDLTMEQAAHRLQELAARNGTSLTDMAIAVMESAQQRRR